MPGEMPDRQTCGRKAHNANLKWSLLRGTADMLRRGVQFVVFIGRVVLCLALLPCPIVFMLFWRLVLLPLIRFLL